MKTMEEIHAIMEQALKDIEALLEGKLKWTRGPEPNPNKHDTQTYSTTEGDWTLVVASFSIEAQGFAKGSRGYDGMARGHGIVLHLPRELARAALASAEASLGERDDG
jgi:hypothetical protein